MSLGIVIKGPEGLVLAADSRVTIGRKTSNNEIFQVSFDNATKLLSFKDQDYVGAVTYGAATVGASLRTAQSYLPEFEAQLESEGRLSVEDFAERLRSFYLDRWKEVGIADYQGPSMVFVVGGYNEDEHYGRVYVIELPHGPEVQERNPGPNEFGFTWGGQREIIDRIITGYDANMIGLAKEVLNLDDEQEIALSKAIQQLRMPIPLQILPLQDCVDLAIFFIRTTIDAQKLGTGLRGVGGFIEVATITRRDGFIYIQQKQIVGEGN